METQENSSSDFVAFELDDKYLLTSLVAEGSRGKIYAGETKLTHRKVAVKILHSALLSDPEVTMRFKLEAEIASTLNHPNIVNVFGSGLTASGEPYLAMDYVDGESLEIVLETRRKIELAQAISIFVQLARAVEYTHEKNVIHRDLKPNNVLLCPDEQGSYTAKLLDFGIAKSTSVEDTIARELTIPGKLFGSVLYMSPEQVLGKEVDFRSDIYSFGCLLFHTVAGRPPYVAKAAVDCMQMQLNESIPNLADHIPPEPRVEALAAIVNTCMQKDPAQRYQSSLQLRVALERLNEAAAKVQVQAEAEAKPAGKAKTAKFEKSDGLAALSMVLIAAFFTAIPYFFNLDLSKAESKAPSKDQADKQARIKEATALGEKVDASIQQSESAIAQKNYGEAENLARTAYMTSLSLAPDDPRVADSLFLLGQVFELRGNYQGAVQAYEWTLSFRESKFGPMAPQTVSVRRRLEEVQHHMTGAKPSNSSAPRIKSY